MILEFLGRKKNRVKTQKKSHDFLSCLNGVLGPHDVVIISLYIIGSKVQGKVEGLLRSAQRGFHGSEIKTKNLQERSKENKNCSNEGCKKE